MMETNRIEEISVSTIMNIDRSHIDDFIMETDEGTKVYKEKFKKEAILKRNKYVNDQLTLFGEYKNIVLEELKIRFDRLMPKDKTESYDEEKAQEDKLLESLIYNTNSSVTFRLGLAYIVASITEETTLEKLNEYIGNFIDKFKSYGITLGIDDFKYTMFTEKYMNFFLTDSSPESMKSVFESLYFTCPNLKLQLKLNLINIISKYEKELSLYLNGLISNINSTDGDIVEKYVSFRYALGNKIATDEFYNTTMFLQETRKIGDYLEDSATRKKNYDSFALNADYDDLDQVAKNSFNSAMMGLYLTLNELKKYYKYEFIFKDLLKRYKDKDAAKTNFALKKKELEKADKDRLAILKEYERANGIGFLARKDDVKIKNLELKMNEHIKTIDKLYLEYYDLEITNNLNQLSESSTIFDIFLISLTSFEFLVNQFSGEEFSQNTLYENVIEYLRFIYNPNNSVLRKTNALVDFNITNIISEKYKLLDLVLTEESINKDNIDSTLDSVRYVNLIQNIERSAISLNDIKNLCEMKKILSSEEEEK